MRLIFYYVACMIVGNFVAYFIGLFVEYEWGSYASLMVLGGLDICGVDDRTKEGRSGCGCGKRRAGLGAWHNSDLAGCPLFHSC